MPPPQIPLVSTSPPGIPDAGVPPQRRLVHWRRRIIGGLFCLVVLIGWLNGIPASLFKLQAQRQLQRGLPYQAQPWLMWAKRLNGTDAELEFLIARTCRIQGDMNSTRSHLERAWKLGYPVAKLEREQTLAQAQSGQMQAAEPALSALLVDPRGDVTDICEAFVTGYIRTYRLPQAERLLGVWLADLPRQPRALILRAKMQMERFNWKPAEQDLRTVLVVVPEHAEAANLLAEVLLKQKQPGAGLQVLPVAVKNPRTRLTAQLHEVECYRIQAQEQSARRLLQSILRENPDCIQAHLDLGSLESDAGAFELAVRELERARELAPNFPDVRYALAVALRGSGRDTEAKEHFDFVTKARQAVAEAMNLRVKVEQKPTDAELRCRIGTTLLDYGQTERGLVWLQGALDVNPSLVAAHERLAQYYESRANQSDELAKLAIEHRKLASTSGR